jgi:hypothetical protein
MRRGVTASASHEATIEHAGRYLPESFIRGHVAANYAPSIPIANNSRF